ncbi:MAG TPA: aminotransferase class I and II, partial [Flavobacterium sp.]|nr:aminotransferase class I and II [Flavobacterium sp.]
CLYFHHSFTNWETNSKTPFALIKDHVLLAKASKIEEADKAFKAILTDDKIRFIIDMIPEEWLAWQDADENPEEIREVYFKFLTTRLANSEIFIKEAQNARKTLI